MTGPYKEKLKLNPNEQLLLRRRQEVMNEAFKSFFETAKPLLADMSRAELDMMRESVESALDTCGGYRADEEVFDYPLELVEQLRESVGSTALHNVETETRTKPETTTASRHSAFRETPGSVPC